jgi:hypothetical protein
MAYTARNIKDRVATGDDCFYMETLPDGRVKLTPAPDEVLEPGTDINKELLQRIEDMVVWLMNRVSNEISTNAFNVRFNTISGLNVTGVWNESLQRIEC